jgi:hypothetical protein
MKAERFRTIGNHEMTETQRHSGLPIRSTCLFLRYEGIAHKKWKGKI